MFFPVMPNSVVYTGFLWRYIIDVSGETPQIQCEWQLLFSSDIVSTYSGWLPETIK